MPTQVTIDTNLAETEVTITTNDASTNYTLSAGARGPQGPNSITTSTLSNLTGFISANGTTVSGATAGATAGTPSTLVLRNANGGVVFTSTTDAAALQATGSNATAANFTSETATVVNIFSGSGIGLNINSTSGTGAYISSATGIGASIFSGSQTAAKIESVVGNHLDVGSGKLIIANNGDTTLTGYMAFTSTTRPTSGGTGTPAATSLITRADADARYNSIENGTVIEIPLGAISRTYTAGAPTATIATLAAPRISLQTTTTQNNYAVAYAFTHLGAVTGTNTNNEKTFGDKYGWLITGFFGSRVVGCVNKIIIGGTTVAADMVAEGTLAANGIVLESRSDVINTPKFRLVVRSGATTVVSSYSSTSIYNANNVGDFWILINGGTVYAYYRASQYGAWTLLCSVASAIPAVTSAANSLGFACITTDSGVLVQGSFITAYRAYETFNLAP